MHGNTKHGSCVGYRKTPEYIAWINMRQRCMRDYGPDFVNYKGRGIALDPAWNCFDTFLQDMGPRPSPVHTVERKDNDAGYSRANCVWAVRLVQNNNQRVRKDNRFGVRGVLRLASGHYTAQGSWQKTRQHLYYGTDFFEACCRRKSWELSRSPT